MDPEPFVPHEPSPYPSGKQNMLQPAPEFLFQINLFKRTYIDFSTPPRNPRRN